MPKNNSIKSILIIGSGPIVIGQACEFDYSGSQAARSLRDEGIEVSLINSNPATIMTDKVVADHVYLKPLTPESIIEILEERDIDAVLPTMGGQTALNLCIDVDEKGIWKKYNVDIIGVDIDAIHITEDREQFRKLMNEIDIPVAPAKIATSFLQGKKIAQELGFPLVIRPSFTLGGSGASFVHTKQEFEDLLSKGLHASPIHEVLIDKAVVGWKEYELELLRDDNDNVIIICNIENLDPMGIHTGDSITIAPSMTLSDSAYQRMRTMAIKMMRSIGEFAGGCNVQFAVSPDEKEEIVAIEINPRVSRSSALASKATGYPIAKVAAKLSPPDSININSKSGNFSFNSSTANKLIEASSLIAVCGHPPVSTPLILSKGSACAFIRYSASSIVYISLEITAIEIFLESFLHKASVKLVFPAPTGPPIPTLSGPKLLIMFDISYYLMFHDTCYLSQTKKQNFLNY